MLIYSNRRGHTRPLNLVLDEWIDNGGNPDELVAISSFRYVRPTRDRAPRWQNVLEIYTDIYEARQVIHDRGYTNPIFGAEGKRGFSRHLKPGREFPWADMFRHDEDSRQRIMRERCLSALRQAQAYLDDRREVLERKFGISEAPQLISGEALRIARRVGYANEQ